MLAAGWQMHGSSLQHKQTHCEHLNGRYLSALWEMSLSRGACHFLVGETSLLELSLRGCGALKYWCIVGAGVYCREWQAQRVLVCCPDDCAGGSDTHTCTRAHTLKARKHKKLWSMDTQQLSRILPLLVQNTHVCTRKHKHLITQSIQISHTLTLTQGVKLPNAPAANTWETDERLSHSQQAAAKDESLKLHPLTSSFTINTHTVNTFPPAYPQRVYNLLSCFSLVKCGSVAVDELRPSFSPRSSTLCTHTILTSTPPSLCDQCSPPTWTYIKVPSASTTTTTPCPSMLKVGWSTGNLFLFHSSSLSFYLPLPLCPSPPLSPSVAFPLSEPENFKDSWASRQGLPAKQPTLDPLPTSTFLTPLHLTCHSLFPTLSKTRM